MSEDPQAPYSFFNGVGGGDGVTRGMKIIEKDLVTNSNQGLSLVGNSTLKVLISKNKTSY
jgi:hypothetical protein